MAQLVAKKYAVALFELYKENEEKGDDRLYDEASLILSTLADEKGFKDTLLSPRITAEQKIELTNKVFDGASDEISCFLNVVIRKNREKELVHMLNIFLEMAEAYRGVLNAVVYSAMPLTEEQVERIEKSLREKTNKTVNIEVKVDKTLIGGLCIKAGGFIYDTSVKRQLADMRLSLLG